MTEGRLRPWVHASLPLTLFLYPWLGREGMLWASGSAVLLNAIVLPRLPVARALRREGEPVVGGLVTYPLAVFILFLAAEPHRAALAWIALALADPAASAVGRRFGKARLPWNARKTVVGFFTFAWVAAGAMAWLLPAVREYLGTTGPRQSGIAAVPLAGVVIAAAVAAAVESLPLPMDDNLPVAMAAGGALTVCGV